MYERLAAAFNQRVNIYNLSFELRPPASMLRVQRLFDMLVELSAAAMFADFLSELLLLVGMPEQSARAAYYCGGQGRYAQQLKRVYHLHQGGEAEASVAERWGLR